jgi:hypothetical protein
MILFEHAVEKIVEENKQRFIQYLLDSVSPVMKNFPQFDLVMGELQITHPGATSPDTVAIYYKWDREEEELNDLEVWFCFPLTAESTYHTRRGFVLQMDCDEIKDDSIEDGRNTNSFFFEDQDLFDVDRNVHAHTILSRFVEGQDLYYGLDEDCDDHQTLHA